MSKVVIPLAQGFEEIEAVSAIDVLRRGGVEVIVASIEDDIVVTGAHGLKITADVFFKEVAGSQYEAILLPGGGEGTDRLGASTLVADELKRAKANDFLICAICAAPLVLVKAGVLNDGQHITCYPSCIAELDRPCANVPAVADDNVITGQGPAAGMLFALIVLSRLQGDAVARKVASGMLFDGF